MRFQKPRIDFRTDQLLTGDSSIELEAFIQDEWDIEDYYVIVQQRTGPLDVETRKLDYQSVGATETDLFADVELFKGHNQISVVTRNDAGIETQETIYMYRE